MIRIAVLITCHNRRERTLACLTLLRQQERTEGIDVKVYLVDDGCTDGTAHAVRKYFPSVNVLEGNGELYWCGGMRLAFAEALKNDHDYYLWLNDDTELFPDALDRLLSTELSFEKLFGRKVIVSGSIRDSDGNNLTYGGSTMKYNIWKSASFIFIEPGNEPKRCDVFNGNCVLIPSEIARRVGNIREGFTQGGGDRDYGIRAAQLGISSWICPGYVGKCSYNHILEGWKKNGLTIKERVEIVSQPVRVKRIRDWMLFTRYHFKIIWPIYWVRSYIRLWLPRLWVFWRMMTARDHTMP